MLKGKKILAVTPARGGSKGLPGKNIRELCGQPLLSYPIRTAFESKYIDDVLVSTDCAEIAAVAMDSGAGVMMRSAELASDTSMVADVLRDLLMRTDTEYDYMVLLEATSPLRTVKDVDECIELIILEGLDSVATFSAAEPPPTRLWKFDEGRVVTYLDGANPWLPRQLHEEAYCLNGLVYVFDVQAFLKSKSDFIFFGEKSAVVTDHPCVDIDTIDDFELAAYLMEKSNG
jgi:CMP-N-acetylneuraminic acid synthetase